MSIPLWLKERLGPRVRYQEGFSRVRSGSPARYALRAEPGFVKSISAIQALVRRHVAVPVAKREIERVMVGQEIVVDLPILEDAAAFEAELRRLGIRAVRQDAAAAAEG